MDLSIVIVNYKSREPLLECLAALFADPAAARAEIVVVDNDSGDGTVDMLAARHPHIRTIQNRENVGFARAVNQGIAAGDRASVLLLNPDCVPAHGAVGALLGYLERHPRTGVAGPRILNSDGSLEYSARGYPDHLTFLFNRYSLLTRLFPNNRHSRRYLLSDWDHASERDVDWVSGAAMMVRREAIREVGPMDEAFFMFNEDVDWCRRMTQRGWAVSFVPAATVVHHIGASRRKVAARVIVERHRGMSHYLHKHHPAHPALMLLADTLIAGRAGLMLTANALRGR